jgi:hypothetical protein
LTGPARLTGLLVHDHLHAGVIILGDLPEIFGGLGAFAHEDLFALELLVGLGHLDFLGDLHGGHDLVALGIEQGDFVAGLDGVGFLLGGIQGDGHGPEGAVASRNLSQTLFQSALVMKPVSGLKPPIPIMIRSPLTRGEIETF